jgi:hypothetical protein
MEPKNFKNPDSVEAIPPTPEKKKGRLTNAQKIMAYIAIASLLIGGGFGGGIAIAKSHEQPVTTADSADSEATEPQSTNSEIAVETTAVTVDSTPDTQSTTSTIEAQPTTTSPEIKNPGSLEIFEQTISVEAMDAMTIEEFAKVPYVDRAAYAYLKNPEFYENAASIDEAFDPKIVVGFYWQPLRRLSIINKNVTEGAKSISALAYYTTDENTGEIDDSYQASVDSILKNGGIYENTSDVMHYLGNGATQQGKDRDGNDIEWTNITYQYYSRQTGELEGPLYTTQILQIAIKLDDGRTIVAYPGVYTIEGQQSPDPNYPY